MTLGAVLKKFPDITFKPSDRFVWSPVKRTVYYDASTKGSGHGLSALLHEIGHAYLGHVSYDFDIELLNMEVQAWEEARRLARKLKLELDEQHIDRCMETYRLWVHKRALCPSCDNTSVQTTPRSYRCFNCSSQWQVAQTRSTQPRRMQCISPF